MAKFKVGNKVQVISSKSSGIKFTVDGVYDGIIVCTWQDLAGFTHSTAFNARDLELCDEPAQKYKYGLTKNDITFVKDNLKKTIKNEVAEFKNNKAKEFDQGYRYILKHIQTYFKTCVSKKGNQNDIANGKFLQPLTLENLPIQKIPSNQFIQGIKEGLKDLSDDELKISLIEDVLISSQGNKTKHYTIEFNLKNNIKPKIEYVSAPVAAPVTYHNWKFLLCTNYQWCTKCGVVYMGKDRDHLENMVLYQSFLIPGYMTTQEKPYGSMLACKGIK